MVSKIRRKQPIRGSLLERRREQNPPAFYHSARALPRSPEPPGLALKLQVPLRDILGETPLTGRTDMTNSLPLSPTAARPPEPEVSVVIPTYNRAELLPALIDALLAQQRHAIAYEILIVDNASTDGTAATVAARAHPVIRYLYEPRPGASNARNAGIQHAAGALIAFIDDDLLPAADWLQTITATMRANPEADCVGGRIEPKWPRTPPPWLTPANYAPLALQYGRGSGKPLSASNASGCLVSANFICRRDVLRDVGGFSPAFVRDEDREFNLRLWRAGKIGIYADAIVATAVVQSERLTKAYHRRWHAVTGANHARMRLKEIIAADGHLTEPVTRHRLFGTPAYVYRELGGELINYVLALVARRAPETFTAECRVRYLVSYMWTRALEDVKGPPSLGPHSAQAPS
ncbi:MAG: glycosyltransferase family A protein [Acidobacteriota bacterium]